MDFISEDIGRRLDGDLDRGGEILGRLLIADDEDGFRESTAELLRAAGYECLCARDGESALEILRTNQVDAVIADIKMPGNTHLEVLDRLHEMGSDAPVILVTGYPSMPSAVESLNRGVCGYLIKPFSVTELLDLLERSVSVIRGVRRIRKMAEQANQIARDAEGLATSGIANPATQVADSTRAAQLATENLVEILRELKAKLDPAEQRTAPETGTERDSVGRSRPLRLVTEPDIEAPGEIPGMELLTRREREVLARLEDGDRVPSIARDLSISQNTVRNHLKAIFRKLRVNSQVELLDLLKAARGR